MKLAHIIEPGTRVSLAKLPTDEKGPYEGKHDPEVARRFEKDIGRLTELQELLFAEKRRALLVILQAMDTAGKDGVLRTVGGPLDSRGVQVVSFGPPSSTELAHDYLWRVHQHTPRRGDIAFFNRSHYEEVLVVRVTGLVPKSVWKHRFDHINAFERMLSDEGTRVVKVFLHISKAEQKRRLEERLAVPEKRWKFDPTDLKMRALWDDCQTAYEDVLERTSTDYAPWYVVPADRKWFRDLAVAGLLVDVLEEMDPKAPVVDLDPAKLVIPD
jgi:PPK2 family polyphosphate:nucleotide phosphotransferase